MSVQTTADAAVTPAWDADFVRRALWATLVLGLVLRLAILAGVRDMGLPIVDEQHYHQLAVSIRAGKGFAFEDGIPTSIRPPLYPAFAAAVWMVTGGESLQAVRAAQVVLSLLTTLLVYH